MRLDAGDPEHGAMTARHYVTVTLPSGWVASYSHVHGEPRTFRWEVPK